jgi:hypothetical protein
LHPLSESYCPAARSSRPLARSTTKGRMLPAVRTRTETAEEAQQRPLWSRGASLTTRGGRGGARMMQVVVCDFDNARLPVVDDVALVVVAPDVLGSHAANFQGEHHTAAEATHLADLATLRVRNNTPADTPLRRPRASPHDNLHHERLSSRRARRLRAFGRGWSVSGDADGSGAGEAKDPRSPILVVIRPTRSSGEKGRRGKLRRTLGRWAGGRTRGGLLGWGHSAVGMSWKRIFRAGHGVCDGMGRAMDVGMGSGEEGK